MNQKKGFTLIELLIVIAVIGILASAVLIGLGPVQRRGRDARRVSDLRQIQNALELYNTRYATYPDTPGDFLGMETVLTDPATGVVTAIPHDPLLQTTMVDYEYDVDVALGTYVLAATLEDEGSNVLANDIDGTLLGGIDCDGMGPVAGGENKYCIQL
jgi:prepilin-type N-terminal cleavage/methylation domain-containing protein